MKWNVTIFFLVLIYSTKLKIKYYYKWYFKKLFILVILFVGKFLIRGNLEHACYRTVWLSLLPVVWFCFVFSFPFICRKFQSETEINAASLLDAVFFSHLEMGNIKMTHLSEFPLISIVASKPYILASDYFLQQRRLESHSGLIEIKTPWKLKRCFLDVKSEPCWIKMLDKPTLKLPRSTSGVIIIRYSAYAECLPYATTGDSAMVKIPLCPPF